MGAACPGVPGPSSMRDIASRCSPAKNTMIAWEISAAEGKPSSKNTDLDQKEKSNMRRMEAFKCDITGPIASVSFPVADKRYTLCDVANDGRLDFDALGVK